MRYLHFSTLLFVASAGCDQPCSPDGACPGRLRCDFSDHQCRAPCRVDLECPAEHRCIEPLGLCRPGAPSAAPVAEVDAGLMTASDGGVGCEGVVGCPCYPNGTCDHGFVCSGSVCVSGRGQRDQPCLPNRTCLEPFECVRDDRGDLCRPPGFGRPGQPCYAAAPVADGLECRSAAAVCLDGICRGGLQDDCRTDEACRPGLRCEDGRCARPAEAPCDSRAQCATGEFCCGEPGAPECGAAAAGECFEAESFRRACEGSADCEAGSNERLGPSLCMPWGEDGQPWCSVPCEADSRCPAGWRCEDAFVSCLTDADCGFDGLRCVLGGSGGRCRCGTGGVQVAKCSADEGAPGAPRCRPGPGSELSCVLTTHCAPPR